MNEVKLRSGQIVELQSLRGIAALSVAIGHTLTYYYATSSYGSMVFNGRGAVVVFFVLSGYVLTCAWRSSRFGPVAVLKFWTQRVFRIYPAMWVATALGLWYLVALHWNIRLADGSPGAPGAFRPDRFNLWFIGGSFSGMVAYVLPQLWSIHVELLGSLVMPLIAFIALHRSRWELWSLMVMATGVSYAFGSLTIYHSALFLLDFVVGSALAAGALTPLLQNLPAPKMLFTAGLAGLALVRFLPIVDYYSPTAHLIETVLAALLIGLLAECRTPRFMRSASLLFIGKISYSIYLLFFVVMCTTAKALALLQSHGHVGLGVSALSIMLAFSTLAVLIPAAWLLFTYAEQPGMRAGKIAWAKWREAHGLLGSLVVAPNSTVKVRPMQYRRSP